MRVTVWSVLTGKLSGHLVMNVSPSLTLHKLLTAFCSHKGVSVVGSGYAVRGRDNHLLNLNKTLSQAEVKDGDTLTLGLMDDEERTLSFGRWLPMGLVCLLTGVVGLTVTIWLAIHPQSIPQTYGVVIDAGSSHSEVFVYTWDSTKLQDTAHLQLINRCFVPGGVNSYATHVRGLGSYFNDCMEATAASIPLHLHHKTPLYLGATAGMRILRDFQSEGAETVMATLREYFATKTKFLVQHNNIQILPGGLEGSDGWIAANYLLNTLQQSDEHTAATIDVGGASMQVSSRVSHEGPWNTTNITLFNSSHRVHSKSFLCYGVGLAQNRYNYLLIHQNRSQQEEAGVIRDPCVARGRKQAVLKKEINGPCTYTGGAKPDLSSITDTDNNSLRKIYTLYNRRVKDDRKLKLPQELVTEAGMEEEEEEAVVVVVEGSGDAGQCEGRVSQLFDPLLCHNTFKYGACLDPSSLPPISGTLVAFSSLFSHLVELFGLGKNATLEEFRSAVYDVCSATEEGLQALYPEEESEIVEDVCFDSMFVYKLLTQGLGVSNASWPKLLFTEKLNNSEVVWPSGHMLRLSNQLAPSPTQPRLSAVSFGLLVVLSLAFMSCAVLFLHHYIKIRSHSTSYQRCALHQA